MRSHLLCPVPPVIFSDRQHISLCLNLICLRERTCIQKEGTWSESDGIVKNLASRKSHSTLEKVTCLLSYGSFAETHATALQDGILAGIDHFNVIDLSTTILGGYFLATPSALMCNWRTNCNGLTKRLNQTKCMVLTCPYHACLRCRAFESCMHSKGGAARRF